MSQVSTYDHAYIKVKYRGELHEAGVGFLTWPAPSEIDMCAVCIDITGVDCDVTLPMQVVKSSLKKYLKTHSC